MSEQTAYWTAADTAELDVLIAELARGKEFHREHCRACQPGDCPVYADWRRARDLLSRAKWLRLEQDESDAA